MLTTTEYDHHLPIGSLPKALMERGVDWKKDASARFFYADRGRSDQLRSKLCRNQTLLCGITWKSFRADLGLRKSLDLTQLKPLFDIPNIRLVNLQYGDVRHETDAFEAALGRKPFFDTKIDNYHDLDGHSALIDACDLLIMSCNASAHLAGAMGKNVFLLAPRSQSRIWYWSNLNDRRSAWYPSIEIFYQSLDGSWTAAIRSIEERLRQHINHLPSR